MIEADAQDWAEYVGGDNEAMARIHNRHRDGLLKYCAYATGSRARAQDVVQETFLRLMNQRGRLSIRTSLADWLFVCARNLCFNWNKREKGMTDVDQIAEQVDQEIDVETKQFIEQVLSRLSIEERDLILMREQRGYSINEIAILLGISEENVRVRLFRVRKRMQEIGRS